MKCDIVLAGVGGQGILTIAAITEIIVSPRFLFSFHFMFEIYRIFAHFGTFLSIAIHSFRRRYTKSRRKTESGKNYFIFHFKFLFI